ncbi:hypothetical protein ACPC39_33350 [Streptomyces cellulosae]
MVNKKGFKRVFDFAELSVPQPMRCSLARAFAAQSMGWSSHSSGESYWRSLEVFARFLKAQGYPAEDFGDLTSATLRLWRNHHKDTPGGREALAKMRTLLRRESRLAKGLAAEGLARPVPKKGKPSKQSYRPSSATRCCWPPSGSSGPRCCGSGRTGDLYAQFRRRSDHPVGRRQVPRTRWPRAL